MKTKTSILHIPQQVCSLKLAKRLKKLGVPQMSLLEWSLHTDGETLSISSHIYDELQHMNDPLLWDSHEAMEDGQYVESYAAFTVAELGRLLPMGAWDAKKRTWSIKYGTSSLEGEKYWLCVNTPFKENGNVDYSGDNEYKVEDHHEANARAEMLIYLLEKGIIKL